MIAYLCPQSVHRPDKVAGKVLGPGPRQPFWALHDTLSSALPRSFISEIGICLGLVKAFRL